MGNPRRQVAKLDVQDRGVDVVKESGIAVKMELSRLSVLPVKAKQADRARYFGIVRRHGSAVAEPAKRLEWIEAEAPRKSKGPSHLAVKRRAESLGRVLDHNQAILGGNLLYAIHLT